MQLVQIQDVIAIAEYKSISQAAKELFISQPTLSEALISLEKELGFQIFERGRRGVTLTAKGQEIYRIAQNIQKSVDEIKSLSTRGKSISSVRLTSIPMISSTIFINIIDNLYRKMPNLRIYPDEGRPNQVLNNLEDGKTDIAFENINRINKERFATLINKSNMQKKLLCKIPVVAIVPADSPMAKLDKINRQQLFSYHYRHIYLTDYCDCDFQSEDIMLANRDLILNAVSHNVGYTMMPETAIFDYDNKNIKIITMAEEKKEDLFLLYPSKELITPIQEKIINLITNCINQLGYNK
ncbi:LysR family transcriptional regulator [Lactobacillus sp. XV13L]|nr:LysR family transcriptional regulator [Lactobacillus sp. XV13L]